MRWKGSDVTVVIPTYNRAALLEKAIASALAQTEPVGAIIVVDDGSTDDSRERVAALAARDPRISLRTQANAGANVARNTGVAAAATALVGFLDSDDRWMPEKIERQLAAWRARPDAVASFTGILAVDGDRPLYSYDIPVELTIDEIRRHNVLGSTSTALVRTDVLRAVGGFDPGLPSCQDWDLYLRLRRAGPFATVTDDLVLYDDGPHDRITHQSGKTVAGHEAVFARALSDVDDPRERRRIRAAHAEVMTRLYLRHGDWRAARRQAIRAAVLDPNLIHVRKLARIVVRRAKS
jgi:glycosyltransferase involved in cell wall biosynthesis